MREPSTRPAKALFGVGLTVVSQQVTEIDKGILSQLNTELNLGRRLARRYLPDVTTCWPFRPTSRLLRASTRTKLC
jgi:hypothetical protein